MRKFLNGFLVLIISEIGHVFFGCFVYVGFVNCRPLLRGNVIKIQIHTKADKLVDNAMCVVVQCINHAWGKRYRLIEPLVFK